MHKRLSKIFFIVQIFNVFMYMNICNKLNLDWRNTTFLEADLYTIKIQEPTI
jgi:hypothetical protein